MDSYKIITDKFKKFFDRKQNKIPAFIMILGCIGLLLVFLSEFIPKEKQITKESFSADFTEFNEKENILEDRLENIISKINGAGKTEVMLTLASSGEYFYAENHTEEKDENELKTENEIIIIEGENGEEPVFLTKKEAEIRGVLVICEGGKNALVREKIIEALCALLDIPSNRVSVAEMA